jgi:DnaJ homolog subfamily C member 17
MSSRHDRHNSFPEKGNPYEALSLKNFATSVEIKKKFRELSLKLHPDKRQANISQKEKDDLDHQFILVQEARSFLLDDEYRDKKEKYDAKLQSEILRKEDDQRREEQMGSQRRKMKKDLEDKINQLKRTSDNRMQSKDTAFDDLKTSGKRMRESYSDRWLQEEERRSYEQRKRRKDEIEDRQVRVKWSRKKIGGQSEDSLAKLLERFGTIEEVELIGSKGNAALVTFADASSCQTCVDAYLHSDELRATYLGARKQQADKAENDDDVSDFLRSSLKRERDRESVEERKLRQAAEREAILRSMEMGNVNKSHEQLHEGLQKVKKSVVFPPSLPQCTSELLSSIERLEQAENEILKGLLSSDDIKFMQTS